MSRKFYEKQDNTSEKSEFPHTRRQFPVDRKLGYRTGGAGAPGWGKVCFPTLLKKCEKALDKRRKEWYNRRVVERPFGQAAKTPPSHGGNGGSIPPGVTRIQRNRIWHPLGACPVFLLQKRGGPAAGKTAEQAGTLPSLCMHARWKYDTVCGETVLLFRYRKCYDRVSAGYFCVSRKRP